MYLVCSIYTLYEILAGILWQDANEKLAQHTGEDDYRPLQLLF